MSDDEVDSDLLELLRKSLAVNGTSPPGPAKTGVLEDAEYIYDNSTDVALDMRGTKLAASSIWALMQEKQYSTADWSKHELHPKAKDASTVDFIFLMDLLNFCFWSDDPTSEQYAVEYRGKKWTGYWSLVASIQRALDEGIPITSPAFWIDETECSDDLLQRVFRAAPDSSPIPLMRERINCIREAGRILRDRFNGTFTTCIEESDGSAAALVNLLVDNFPCFDDRHSYQDAPVRFHKRAQILVADLWACFHGGGDGDGGHHRYGSFHDIDHITMFADYRLPQVLHSLGCLQYSPPLESHVRRREPIASGHPWEMQLRGCSIWCVELLRREMRRLHTEAPPHHHLNAILIDFFLYDSMKEMEANGHDCIPHHRTRSIWY